MEKWLYVMTIKKGKTYNKVTKAVITRHVENLRKLDEADREAMIRRYYYGQKPKEIAAALGIPKKQVENRLYQGKQKLRRMMLETQ